MINKRAECFIAISCTHWLNSASPRARQSRGRPATNKISLAGFASSSAGGRRARIARRARYRKVADWHRPPQTATPFQHRVKAPRHHMPRDTTMPLAIERSFPSKCSATRNARCFLPSSRWYKRRVANFAADSTHGHGVIAYSNFL